MCGFKFQPYHSETSGKVILLLYASILNWIWYWHLSQSFVEITWDNVYKVFRTGVGIQLVLTKCYTLLAVLTSKPPWSRCGAQREGISDLPWGSWLFLRWAGLSPKRARGMGSWASPGRNHFSGFLLLCALNPNNSVVAAGGAGGG